MRSPKPRRSLFRVGAKNATFVALALAVNLARGIDLTRAVVVAPPNLTGPEKKAVAMLVEEAEKRTRRRWEIVSAWPAGPAAVVAIGPASALPEFAGPFAKELQTGENAVPGAPEGYRLFVRQKEGIAAAFVIGNDARGVLFGAGRLLRLLHLRKESAVLEDQLEIATAPKYPLRGHQLGYRPKCNSYDAWDLPRWEQYYRDLAVFGCNAIELIPPRSDDDADSPHFPRPPMEMMTGMSRLADDYGLDVWIWYPAMDKDYSDPATVEFALKEWAQVFDKLPRIDAVFVPGGDPGHTRPKFLMALLEKQAESLRRRHPKAQMWVSPQSFNQEWLDEFIAILNDQRPAWLSGVVYGPQVRVPLARLRELVPRQYPIRHYPDITHSRQCEYPVPDWDVAYAVTEARECVNPRPEDESIIFHKTQPGTVGFISYSEGCNDDVNKFVWCGLGWNPNTPAIDILRDYGRYFVGEAMGDDFARGLLSLEQDWRGSLLANQNVETTVAQFQSMERSATPAQLANWRFQQGLYRAYYDGYVRRRLVRETDLEERAMEALRPAPVTGSSVAMARAEQELDRALTERVAEDLRQRIFTLAEALFQSVGMQLSVEKYKAIAVDRGASLDTLDYPLNNRIWLKEQFAKIREIKSEPARLAALDEIVNWTNPGPGGFYDDLGNPARQPHLVRGAGFGEDPSAFALPRSDFEEDLVLDDDDPKPMGSRRVSWMDHAEILYDGVLRMHYDGLDPKARYKLRVVYAGDNPERLMRLTAGENIEIHPLIKRAFPYKPQEFDIPPDATARGQLELAWRGQPGLAGNGRNCQVAEVWLIKKSPAEK